MSRSPWPHLIARIALAAVTLCGGCRTATRPADVSEAPEIAWVTSYEDGLAEAKAASKPILMDLYADWCGPCRRLDEETWSDPKVRELAQEFVCLKINVDEDRNTAEKYGASSIPLVVFLSAEGEELSRSVGFVDAAEMLKLMEDARNR